MAVDERPLRAAAPNTPGESPSGAYDRLLYVSKSWLCDSRVVQEPLQQACSAGYLAVVYMVGGRFGRV